MVLSLLLNLILLSCTVLWWTGGFIGATLPGGFQLGSGGSGGASVRLRPAGLGAFAYKACQRPQLDEAKLDEWGCKVFHRACFDQDTLLLHSGVKTPGHANYSDAPAFEVDEVPPYVLPGYEESLGTAHYLPKKWFMHIRAPTHLDPPDVWQPTGGCACVGPGPGPRQGCGWGSQLCGSIGCCCRLCSGVEFLATQLTTLALSLPHRCRLY